MLSDFCMNISTLDHTYSPQPDQYPFGGNIKKKSKFVFFRIYLLREIFLQDKQETSKLYPWQLPRLPLCWRDLTMHWYCTRLKVCLFKTYQSQMKGNSSCVSNLGRNDPLEIIQLSLKWGIQFKLVKVSSNNHQRLATWPSNLYTHPAMARIYI